MVACKSHVAWLIREIQLYQCYFQEETLATHHELFTSENGTLFGRQTRFKERDAVDPPILN